MFIVVISYSTKLVLKQFKSIIY